MPQQNLIILYCSVPIGLAYDRELHDSAVRSYLYLHSLPGEKDFNTHPDLQRLVKEKNAVKTLRISIGKWRRSIRELRKRGWITVENRGWKGNLITLHGRRRRGR